MKPMRSITLNGIHFTIFSDGWRELWGYVKPIPKRGEYKAPKLVYHEWSPKPSVH